MLCLFRKMGRYPSSRQDALLLFVMTKELGSLSCIREAFWARSSFPLLGDLLFRVVYQPFGRPIGFDKFARITERPDFLVSTSGTFLSHFPSDIIPIGIGHHGLTLLRFGVLLRQLESVQRFLTLITTATILFDSERFRRSLD